LAILPVQAKLPKPAELADVSPPCRKALLGPGSAMVSADMDSADMVREGDDWQNCRFSFEKEQ
jgi:hypothetical protein